MKKTILWKRMVALMTVCTLMTGTLIGCAKQEQKESTSNQSSVVSPGKEEEKVSTVTTVVPEEPAELTFWGAIDSNAATVITNYSELGYMQELMKLANVNITFKHPASGTAAEQFNLKVVGKNYEDMIEYSWDSYPGGAAQAIADGVIINIADYLEYAPNFSAYLENNPEIAKQIYTTEGQICYFPAIRMTDSSISASVTGGYIIRKDYLDKLNMDVPETVDDWEKMLLAFKNELNIAKPFSNSLIGMVGINSYFAGAWGTYGDFYLENGVVKYGPVEDSFKEYIGTMADWCEQGLIDMDFPGNTLATARNNLLNDVCGATYGFIGSVIGTVMNSAKETNPNLVLVGAKNPVLNKGEDNKFVARSWDISTGSVVAISTSCQNIEAAIRFLDLLYSEEGNLLKNFGVEGVSYNMVDGYPTYTDEILNNPDGLSISEALGKYTRASQASTGFVDPRYTEQYYQLQEQVDALHAWNDNANKALDVLYPPTSLTLEESEELASIETSLTSYVQEQLTKFILGTRSMEEYDDFVKELEGMNVARAIEIKQAAYDRYLNK